MAERGELGVLYVDGETCAYMMCHEFSNSEFRKGIEALVRGDKQQHFFVVQKKEGHLHVFSHPCSEAVEHLENFPESFTPADTSETSTHARNGSADPAEDPGAGA